MKNAMPTPRVVGTLTALARVHDSLDKPDKNAAAWSVLSYLIPNLLNKQVVLPVELLPHAETIGL